jgi:hypothetical protein
MRILREVRDRFNSGIDDGFNGNQSGRKCPFYGMGYTFGTIQARTPPRLYNFAVALSVRL